MTLTMRMGLRNLARQPRRTILTALMLVVGTALAVWMNGISQGMYATFIDGTTRSWLGHFQVLEGDYNDKPSLFKTVDHPDLIITKLSLVPGVQGVTSRVETAGLLAADNRTVGVALVGVDPLLEARTSHVPGMLAKGQWFTADQPTEGEALPILIGSGVAERLKVGIGQEVSFVGQAADGSIAAELYKVRGIMSSGSAEIDGGMALVRLRDAQELLALGSRVHRVIGTVERTGELDDVMARLPRPERHRLMDWMELDPGLHQSIKADRDSGQIMLWIILLVAVLGVANTMLMSVFERTREFGIMLALGTSPRRVIAITLWEVVWLAAASVALGASIGATLTALVQIPSPAPIEWSGVVITTIAGRNTWFGSVLTPSLIFVASLVSGFWPARRAAKLNPVTALRST